MPRKDFIIWLEHGLFIAVDFETDGPRMVSFVVRLVFTDDHGEHTIARYDTAHGTAHRDLLTPANRLREKKWMSNVDFFRALDYAIKDFKENHASYLQKWLAAKRL